MGDTGSIPGLGRPLGGGNATYSSILAWEIPRTEEPGRLQSLGVAKESDTTEQLNNNGNNRTWLQRISGTYCTEPRLRLKKHIKVPSTLDVVWRKGTELWKSAKCGLWPQLCHELCNLGQVTSSLWAFIFFHLPQMIWTRKAIRFLRALKTHDLRFKNVSQLLMQHRGNILCSSLLSSWHSPVAGVPSLSDATSFPSHSHRWLLGISIRDQMEEAEP